MFGALPLAEVSWDGGSLDNLNAGETDPVAGSHLIVHQINSTIKSCVTELLVHVVVASSTLVPQPYTIVLNLGWVLLINLRTKTTCEKMLSMCLINNIKPQKLLSENIQHIYSFQPHVF